MKLALIGFGNVGRAFARLLEAKRSAYPFRVTAIHTARHGTAYSEKRLGPEPEFGPAAASVDELAARYEVDPAYLSVIRERVSGVRGPFFANPPRGTVRVAASTTAVLRCGRGGGVCVRVAGVAVAVRRHVLAVYAPPPQVRGAGELRARLL